MALVRLNYASSGERTDFSGMVSLLSSFSLKLNLHVEKKYLLLLRALKNPIIVTYPSLPVFLSIFLPAYNVERIRSEYSLFPRLTNRTYSFVLFAFLLIAH